MKEKIHSMNHMFAYIQKHFPAIRVQQMSEVPMKQEKLAMNVVQDKASIVMKLKGNHTYLKRLSDAIKEQEDWQAFSQVPECFALGVFGFKCGYDSARK